VPDDQERHEQSRHGYVVLPETVRSPWWSLGLRLLLGLAIIAVTVLLVWVDRSGYRDSNDPPYFHINLVDALYYTTVTLSTTGYGDIAPFSPSARLVNAFVITPLRIAFLVLLIGTTLEVLATQGRRMFRIARWRRHMSNPVVIVGYGTKGRSAAVTLVNNGVRRENIIVVDKGGAAVSDAHADGLAVVTGDATRSGVLQRAGVEDATQVIITTDRDDSNVLSCLTVRQLNANAYIVAAVRRQLGDHLVRRGRPPARPLVAVADPGHRDGGSADLRRGTRGRRARSAGQ
jgi:voltage-gated potassium channel